MTETAKCGNCAFAYMFPQDLKLRVCKGGPPQVVVLPNAQGAIGMQYVYPMVNPGNDPCAAHKFKEIVVDDGIKNA